MSFMIKTAIIHSHPIYRQGLSVLLEHNMDSVEIIGGARSLRDLINKYSGRTLDLIIWDIPSHHVLAKGIKTLRECFPIGRLLVLVSSSNTVYSGILQTLGANAVLPSTCQAPALFKTILQIHEKYSPPPASNHVQEPMSVVKDLPLTSIELTLLRFKCQGLTDTELQQQLELNSSSVSNCLSTIKDKLGVNTVAELLRVGSEYFQK